MKIVRSLTALATLAALHTWLTPATFAEPIPEDCKQGGFFIGCQAYSFNRYTIFEAIEKTEEAGGKIIEFYPQQKLSKEEPNLKCDHDSSDEVLQKVKDKLAKHHIRAVNYGVVRIPPDEAGARKIFEFAKKMGLYAVTTESVESLDVIEKLVKEYDIRVGIHEHGRRLKQDKKTLKWTEETSYKVWDPFYVLTMVQDRDPRIGACADTGHWQTSGFNPVYCLRLLKGHIISVHMKDKTDFGPTGHDLPYGTGVGDAKRVLDELKAQNFNGNISIEYEYNWEASVPDIKKCIDFVRNYPNMK
jgi:sugar phosphate isomerase/epimerase